MLKESIDTKTYAMLNDAHNQASNKSTYKLSQELFRACLERNRELQRIQMPSRIALNDVLMMSSLFLEKKVFKQRSVVLTT